MTPHKGRVLCSIIVWLLISGCVAPVCSWAYTQPSYSVSEISPSSYAPAALFEAGVRVYRAGQFTAAGQRFAQLASAYPTDTRVLYYQAITAVQLKHYSQARQLYTRIVALEPRGSVAPLARKGLAYLPASKQSPVGLDGPPPPPPVVATKPSALIDTEPNTYPTPAETRPASGNTAQAYANKAPGAATVARQPIAVLPASRAVATASSAKSPGKLKQIWQVVRATPIQPTTTASGAIPPVYPANYPPVYPPGFGGTGYPTNGMPGYPPSANPPAWGYPPQQGTGTNPAMAAPSAQAPMANAPFDSTTAGGGMTPQAMQQQMQTMMMMQMMSGLGGGNGNNNGGGGNMNWMMMPGAMTGANGQMDPAVMKEMMMNQMMNGMVDLNGGSNKE